MAEPIQTCLLNYITSSCQCYTLQLTSPMLKNYQITQLCLLSLGQQAEIISIYQHLCKKQFTDFLLPSVIILISSLMVTLPAIYINELYIPINSQSGWRSLHSLPTGICRCHDSAVQFEPIVPSQVLKISLLDQSSIAFMYCFIWLCSAYIS